jgi:hypothetical protein
MDDETHSSSASVPGVEADPELAADRHAMSILSTEHWSLLSARGLAYNESFTRTNMYLTFISLSFVALALLAQAMTVSQDFLVLAAVVLGFDFVIGVLTSIRVVAAAMEDVRATQGMNRIRHGYLRISPRVAPFLITGTHDDLPGIVKTYSMAESPTVGGFAYALSTSGAMVGLITAVVGGAALAVVAMLLDVPVSPLLVGSVAAIVAFGIGNWIAVRSVARQSSRLNPRFPTPEGEVMTVERQAHDQPEHPSVGTDLSDRPSGR